MTPLQWWDAVVAWDERRRRFDPMVGDAAWWAWSSRKEEIEAVGALLVEPTNMALKDAFFNKELDPAAMSRVLRQSKTLCYTVPAAYADLDNTLCREVVALQQPFDDYVLHTVRTTGWTLGGSIKNRDYLYDVLENPNMVSKYPDWFERTVHDHPWAWETVFGEQFFLGNSSPCRDFLYDPAKEPWANTDTVAKMVGWMHFNEAETPRKSALATKAWPEWMAHVRSITQLYYGLVGEPKPQWGPESVWAERYFSELASHIMERWESVAPAPLDSTGLFVHAP